MRAPAISRTGIWLLLAVAGAVVAGPAAEAPELRPIPHTDLERLGEVGAHLLEQTARLESTIARPEAGQEPLAEAYGDLGRLYLAYELWHPGEACLANAATLAPRDPRWSYYLGYLYRRSGRLERAAAQFERTLELRPGYAPAVLRLGRVYLQLGRADRIEPLLRQAGAGVAEESALRVLRGQAALAQRDYEAARQQFAAVLAANPEAGWVHYQMALAYRGLGRLDDARRHLELQTPGSFSIADPLISQLADLATSAGFYWRRALAAYQAGEADQALAEFQRAIEVDPSRTDVRTGLALILEELGDLDGAGDQYREVLQREPEAALARLGLGRLLARSGSHAAAVEEFEAVLDRHPESTGALAARAGALEAIGRHEAALADWTRLVDLEPWNVEYRLARGRALTRAELLDEAVAELRSVLTADPANAPAALDLGGLYARLGRPEAADQLRLVLTLDAPPAIRAAAHFNLGLLLSDDGPIEQAVDQFRAAAELRPEWVEALLRLAETLDASGRYEQAAAEFARAVALRPDAGSARLAEARCLVNAGRFREASARLEEGVARFPDSAAFAQALAHLLAASPEADLRDGARALELATAVVRAEASLEHVETLAMALAELGRFEEAGGVQAELLARAERTGRPETMLQRLRRDLTGYRDGRPARLGASLPDGR